MPGPAARCRALIYVNNLDGSGLHGSGTLAARPESPQPNDTYAVTEGPGIGRNYVSYVAGAWVRSAASPVRALLPVSAWTPSVSGAGSVTVTDQAITMVVAGESNAYEGAGRLWPAGGIDQFRLRFRQRLASADTNALIVTRVYIVWGDPFAPYFLVEFRADGALKAYWPENFGGGGVVIATGISLASSPWTQVEIQGTTVRLWWCINNSDDASACVWKLGFESTLPSVVTYGAPRVLTTHTVSEAHVPPTVTAILSAVTIQDISL